MKARPPLHPIRTALLAALAVCALACLLFRLSFRRTGTAWQLDAAVTAGTTAFHIALRFLSPAVLFLFFRRRYDPKARWFQPRPWEPALYRRLGVKRWKKYALTYEPAEFSLELHSAEEVVENMCHAELVHELCAALSFSSLLFAVPFGHFPVFLATALLSAAIECPFLIIQRYNRPRLVRLAEKKRT